VSGSTVKATSDLTFY